jgi:hypothetical protein
MSDSDDDEPGDPTSHFLYELRNTEPWDATEVHKYGQATLETLKTTDFGNLPERVAFSEIVMERHFLTPRDLENKRSDVFRKTKFMFPVTIACAAENV